VLYWDNDSARLPAALQGDFIDMIDRRVFERPGALTLGDSSIDFRRLRLDGYYVGDRAARHFGGRRTFVPSTSGHVRSIVRPPRLGRTAQCTRGDLPADPLERLARRRTRRWLLAGRTGPTGSASTAARG
jgi:polyhydroxyalkanoate synthase